MSPREFHASGKICRNGLPSATGSRYILLGLCAFVLNIWRKMILVSITLGCCFFWEIYLSHYIAELPLELLYLRHCLMRCFSVVVNKRLLTPDILFSYILEKCIVCDVWGLRYLSVESSIAFYITPTYTMHFFAINNARNATKIRAVRHSM